MIQFPPARALHGHVTATPIHTTRTSTATAQSAAAPNRSQTHFSRESPEDFTARTPHTPVASPSRCTTLITGISRRAYLSLSPPSPPFLSVKKKLREHVGKFQKSEAIFAHSLHFQTPKPLYLFVFVLHQKRKKETIRRDEKLLVP